MNNCTSCNRPLPIGSNKKYCTHCKSKTGNIIGKVGSVLLAALPIVIKFIVKKVKTK